MTVARRIAAHAPGAISDSLQVARCSLERGEAEAWRITPDVEARRLASDEVAEGIAAFVQKRRARWR